jgi:hypothetical protein
MGAADGGCNQLIAKRLTTSPHNPACSDRTNAESPG